MKRFERNTSDVALQWAKDNVNMSTFELCNSIDQVLFAAVTRDLADIDAKARRRLKHLGFNLGGGGNYILLYFLVRKFRPSIVLETGVAAGWSSLAILEALSKNEFGSLYSSDFPYFRLSDPERYIGFVVGPDHLKMRWHLDIRGDEVALREFIASLGSQKIELFHYDSDKSYSGRQFALDIIKNNLSKECIIIFDDIQDNLHFKEFVEKNSMKFKVLEFEGKFLGVIGI